MKLYEIDQKLEDLILQLEPDPETGEIPANEDEIIAEINALAMKREAILDTAFLQQGVKISPGKIRWADGSTEGTGKYQIVPCEFVSQLLGVIFLPFPIFL